MTVALREPHPANAGLAERPDGQAVAAADAPTRISSEIALYGIYEISKILSAPARLEVTLANVAHILSAFLAMRRGTIVVLDDAGDPEIVATGGGGPAAAARPPQRVIDRLVATATPVVVSDIASDPLFAGETVHADPSGARVSFIAVPIKVERRIVGTLSIDRVWDGRVAFRIDEDVRFLAMVANLVGQAVRLHRVLAADRQRLIDERSRLEKALNERPRRTIATPKVGGIVGESIPIRRVLETIAVVAPSNTTVLLRGESGTGKELFARAVHELSPRKGKPFVKLNCAALPESVLESELFGHERGAFTGALTTRAGRFELAHGGTLLLDEIGEISPAFQAKLLRVLQEGEFERVGGTRTLKVDVRLICATNKNLEEAVAKGEFRADLYYRITVVPIFLPPLRDRPSDIPLLARAFLASFNKENGRDLGITDTGLDLISRCYFPGNVRELENCIRRTATLARRDVIGRDDFACAHSECLSATLWAGHARRGDAPAPAPTVAIAPAAPLAPALPGPVELESSLPVLPPMPATPAPHACDHGGPDCPATSGRLTERARLIEAMETAGWVQAKAARLLDLTPRQIGYALKRHNIPMKRF
jgi:Nif-specific regulatory protein